MVLLTDARPGDAPGGNRAEVTPAGDAPDAAGPDSDAPAPYPDVGAPIIEMISLNH
jgi:hypothetical protein